MNASIRKLLGIPEAAAPEAPPVEAPPKTRPETAPPPSERPSPSERPDPWRRRGIDPDDAPEPKAAYGMDQTYGESEARRVVANMLEDEKAPQPTSKSGLRLEPGASGKAKAALKKFRTIAKDIP